MKNKHLILFAAFFTFSASFIISGCNKKFDEPPVKTSTLEELGYKANISINDFKVRTTVGSGGFFYVDDSLVINGVVTANDKSGNFYKQVFIQDSTGAIEVDIEGTGLYNTFPVGKQVAVFCKGLYVANVTGMQKICMRTIQNASPAILGILPAVQSQYVKTGGMQEVVPKTFTSVSQLGQKDQGSLVRFENFEVQHPAELFSTYSDSSANKNTVNVAIVNCAGESTIIRSSAYANFAALPVPQGNGSFTAIYTVFNTTKQFVIRDTSDVQFTGTRCNGTVPGAPFTVIGIDQVRALNNTGTPLPANSVIEGVIVSNTLNEASGNYRIQDSTGFGVQIRFTTAGNKGFLLGDKLRVFVDGLTVAPFNGDIQVNNVPGAVIIGRGTVVPRNTTVADINTNVNNWASSVVKLSNVTIAYQSAGGTTGINYTITDATGTIVTFVRNTLGYTPPATATSITGYVSLFNGTAQLTLRQPSDVQ